NNQIFYVGSAGELYSDNPSKGFGRARSNRARSPEWFNVVKDAKGFEHEIIYDGGCESCSRKKELALIIELWGTIVNKRKQAIGWSIERREKYSAERLGSKSFRFGTKLSEETKKKKSETLLKSHHLTGQKLPQQWRDNISNAVKGKNNVMFGRTG